MGGANVVIGADNTPLKDVLKDSTGAIVLSQKQWENALNGGSEAAENLFDKMKEMKGEAVSHGKVFGFYGKQLAEVGGLAKGTATEIIGLGAALASGMYTVAAVEGIKLAAEAFKELGGGAEQSKEEVKKAAEEIRKELKSLATEAMQLDRQLKGLNPLSKNELKLEDITKIRDAWKSWEQEVESLQEQLKKGGLGVDEFNDLNYQLRQAKLQAESLKREFDKLGGDNMVSQLSGVVGKEKGVESNKEGKKDAEQREKTAEEVSAFLLQKKAELADGERKIDLEYEAEKEAIWRRSENMTQAEYDAELSMASKVHQKKLEMYRREAEAKGNKDYWNAEARANVEGTEDEGQNLSKKPAEVVREENLRRFERERKKAELDRKKAAADEKRDMQELMSIGRSMGSTFGQVFAGMLDGSMSFSKAMATMAQSVIKSVADMAIKNLEAYALSAEGAAYFSQAGIPVIGPALAVAAVAAAAALFSGLIGGISAEGGADLPAGGPYSATLHSREMVLPQRYADVIRGMADGNGGGGGQVVNHNYYAIDMDSFAKHVRKANRDNMLNRRP